MKKMSILIILFITQISSAQQIIFTSTGGSVNGPNGYSSGWVQSGIYCSLTGGPGQYWTDYSSGSWYVYPAPYIISDGDQSGFGFGVFNLTVISVTFGDGFGFTPTVSVGSTNQAIGRFKLTGNGDYAALTGSSIILNGVRTGISNIKLCSSSDDVFNAAEDAQLGSTVASDPGNGNSASFSGFYGSITTGGTYFFVVCDIANDATGIVQGEILENSSLIIDWGELSGTISGALLSNSDASLPVELSYFTVIASNGQVALRWITESEIENLGFNIYRSLNPNIQFSIINDNLIPGAGNSSSRHEYEYADKDLINGITYWYKLEDVDYSGNTELHGPVSAMPSANAAPSEFLLYPNHPNPFNTVTSIIYDIPQNSHIEVKIFNMLGREVITLVNRQQKADYYNIIWDAKDSFGNEIPSGMYFYRIVAKSDNTVYIDTKKLILLR